MRKTHLNCIIASILISIALLLTIFKIHQLNNRINQMMDDLERTEIIKQQSQYLQQRNDSIKKIDYENK